MFRTGRIRSLLIATAVAPLALLLLSLLGATPAAAQDPEAALHAQAQRVEILERRLKETRAQQEEATRRRDGDAIREFAVVGDALEMALNVERGLLRRLKDANRGANANEGAARPDRPDPRKPSAVGIMKELLMLERKADAAREAGRMDEAEKLGRRYDELAEQSSRMLNDMLGQLRGDQRDRAMQLIGGIREAWTNGRQDAALALAAEYDKLVQAAGKDVQPDRPKPAADGLNLRDAVRELYKLDRARREATEAGREGQAAELQRAFDAAAARVSSWIETRLDRLKPDAADKAHQMLDQLGEALMTGRVDDADKLARALQDLFAGSNRSVREAAPAPDRPVDPSVIEELEQQIRQAREQLAVLDREIRAEKRGTGIERLQDLVDKRAALNEQLQDLQTRLKDLQARQQVAPRREPERANPTAVERIQQQIRELEEQLASVDQLLRAHAERGGGAVRALELLDKRAALSDQLRAAQARLPQPDKPRTERDSNESGNDDSGELVHKLVALMIELDELRSQMEDARKAGRTDLANDLQRRIDEVQKMVERLKQALRGR